jgi:hypothetical protein
LRIGSFGTGSGFSRRIDRMVWMIDRIPCSIHRYQRRGSDRWSTGFTRTGK